MSIADEIKKSFKSGSALIKLIYVNIAVFLAVKLIGTLITLLQINTGFSIVTWFAVPADINNLIFKPWTVITYMFLHQDFLHIIFNMLILYWFGQIFLQHFDNKKLLSVYIVGGIAGAALFIISFNLIPLFDQVIPFAIALGASASVMAIVIAISVYIPNHKIHLMFIGPVPLKYIATFYIVLDILSIASENAGGHIAHLGGALFGYLYILQMKKGKNITKGFDRFMDKVFSFFKPKDKFKVTYKRPVNDIEYNRTKVSNQKDVDKILDKIADKGYDSLSKSEKEILFKNSK
jgi:membrane associated rhomboid family serine protease